MIEFPRTFPLRTIVVCFTIWLIATEVLAFDQIKFGTRTHLLEQAARGFTNQRLSFQANGHPIFKGARRCKRCERKEPAFGQS